jgi:hypothetical protein
VKAKPVLQGAGIATLFIAPFAAGFLTPTLGDAYHRIHPLTSIYRAILIAILLAWLAGTLGFLLLERLPERWRRVFWLIPLILLPWLFFRGMSGALADAPYLALQALHIGRLLTRAVAIVSVIVLLSRAQILDRYIAGARLVYAICGFGLFVLVPQIGYHALSPERREASSFERANLPPVSPSAPRIVWILMDELSYDQVFPSRQPDVLLPNFEALAKSSIVFSNVRPIADMTENVLPALLLGRPVVALRKPYAGPPSYRSVAQGPWRQFNQYDTIFADAHSLGWTTGIAGWYNPYCRLLPEVLDRCSWQYSEPGRADLSSGLGSTNTVSQNLLGMVPFRSRLYALMHWPTPDRTQAHRVDYAGVMAQAESLIEDARIRFLFVHLPVPHPPGIYDRVHHAIRDHGTYLDNLVLADESLARLRSVIQSTPAAANTTLIVSSDHSWRTFLWKYSADWSDEGARASQGRFDPRPVLIVTLPEGAGHVVAEPASALVVHRILDSVLRGQVHTPADMDELVREQSVEKHPQQMEDAQTHN